MYALLIEIIQERFEVFGCRLQYFMASPVVSLTCTVGSMTS